MMEIEFGLMIITGSNIICYTLVIVNPTANYFKRIKLFVKQSS